MMRSRKSTKQMIHGSWTDRQRSLSRIARVSPGISLQYEYLLSMYTVWGPSNTRSAAKTRSQMIYAFLAILRRPSECLETMIPITKRNDELYHHSPWNQPLADMSFPWASIRLPAIMAMTNMPMTTVAAVRFLIRR